MRRNRAIADYLRSNGYEEAYSVFKKEAELDVVSTNIWLWVTPLRGFLNFIVLCISLCKLKWWDTLQTTIMTDLDIFAF